MKLTVGDIKKLIEGKPDDAEVLLQMQDGCCGSTLESEAETLRRFRLFRRKLRNALGRAGIMSNPGWTEDDIIQAIEKLAEKRLEEAPPINTLKLNYLRKEARLARQCSETAAKEAANGDPERWDQSRLFLGQAWAFEQMIGYTRGLSHLQTGIAARKGKL